MTASKTPSGRETRQAGERELLARLGLTADANSQDVEAAHDELIRFLESAPRDLRGWAHGQIAAADEAYVLLSDPTADVAGSSAGDVPPARPAEGRSRTAAAAAVAAGGAAGAGTTDEYIEELDPEPPKTKRQRLEAQHRSAKVAEDGMAPRGRGRRRFVRRAAVLAALAVGAFVIAFAGYSAGAPPVPGFSGTPAPEASSGPQVDQAKVADLMKKLAANPKDVATLQALGDLYFQAEDYSTAGGWMEKILAIDPKNVTARLALGAAFFNTGDSPGAEKQWRQVLELDANNLEAHYDLGFMYLSQNPPDLANVKAEWNKVIEIAPDSDAAKYVRTHLQSLEGATASGAPAASGVPAAGASQEPSVAPDSPAPSPAASPAPSR